MNADIRFDGNPLSRFIPVTLEEIRFIITEAASKSCSLDPLPTYLLKECIEQLLPIITAIMNQSLVKSTVPANFKRASIRPLIKKPGLDKEQLKHYRPIQSSLSIQVAGKGCGKENGDPSS